MRLTIEFFQAELVALSRLLDSVDSLISDSEYSAKNPQEVKDFQTVLGLYDRMGRASITVAIAKPSQEICVRCGSNLVNGKCEDVTCPFSDYSQDDRRGWKGHPNSPEPSSIIENRRERSFSCIFCGADEYDGTKLNANLACSTCRNG